MGRTPPSTSVLCNIPPKKRKSLRPLSFASVAQATMEQSRAWRATRSAATRHTAATMSGRRCTAAATPVHPAILPALLSTCLPPGLNKQRMHLCAGCAAADQWIVCGVALDTACAGGGLHLQPHYRVRPALNNPLEGYKLEGSKLSTDSPLLYVFLAHTGRRP